MSSRTSSQPHQPHMVMIVGNHVVGDSRVEKSADSAVKAGYRVTILGFRHRTVFPFSEYRDVPIIRAASEFPRHMHYVASRALQERDAKLDEALGATDKRNYYRQGLAAVDYTAGRGPLTKYAKWARPAVHSLQRAAWRVGPRTEIVREKIASVAESLSDQAGIVTGLRHDGWRHTWPQIADYEEAFVQALIDLEPDIIHSHDRHPMAAAARYAAAMKGKGKNVPWVYDAHEWLPGQVFSGPKRLRAGWLAAEADLIQQADAVLSVSDELAEKMRRRHGLSTIPTVVVNAPRAEKIPMDPQVRRTLREECGLDAETPLLVYVGKLAEVRGIFTMIEALTLMPGVHIAFVASKDPALRLEMTERAQKLGVNDRMHIVDYVPAESVTWYVESATVGMSPLLPTSAHHSAMPTKIREYLQSGLPIVASDLRAQGAFLREHGVGELHEPGNAVSLAEAVKKVLENFSSYTGAIKDDLLKEHTWEGEEQKLFRVWHSLVPASLTSSSNEVAEGSLSADASKEPKKRRIAFQVSTSERSEPLTNADIGHIVFGAFAADSDDELSVVAVNPDASAALPEAFTRWKRLITEPQNIISTVAAPLVGNELYSLTSEQNELAGRGVSRFFLTRPGRLENFRQWMKENPDHPFNDLPDEQLKRFERQTRSTRSFVRDHDLNVLTTGRLSAKYTRNAHWIPVPVEQFAATHALKSRDGGPLRILVLPGTRSVSEQEAITNLSAELNGANVEITQPSSRRFTFNLLEQADVVIDSLSIGEYSDDAAFAMSIGCVVVGHDTTESGAPIVEASLESLSSVIRGLIEESLRESEWTERSQRSRDFSLAEHSSAKTRDAVNAVLGTDN